MSGAEDWNAAFAPERGFMSTLKSLGVLKLRVSTMTYRKIEQTGHGPEDRVFERNIWFDGLAVRVKRHSDVECS